MILQTMWTRWLAGALLTVAAVATAPAQTAALPVPPQTFSVDYAAPTGATIVVPPGGDLQGALDRARLGDTIVLQAGASYAGSFVLPNKTEGSGWIYVQTSAYANLPPPGTRVTPEHAVHMPKIVASLPNTSAIRTADGAHHYRFVGIEIAPAAGRFVTNLVRLGNGDVSVSTLPQWIVFDRCYIRGDPEVGGRRGVAMDGRFIAVVDSHVSDFKERGADTQALWAYNTPGPLKIVNNRLEGAGENVMIGGADASIKGMVPADIEIVENLFHKPLSWIGSPWVVKNLLEFKNAQRVLVARNRFENIWPAGQAGFAWVVTPRNDDGTAPWTLVQDIAFIENVVVNAASGVNILGADYLKPSQRTNRILFRDNLLVLGGPTPASSRSIQIIAGPQDVIFDHNTIVSTSGVLVLMEGGPKIQRLQITNNIFSRGENGIMGSGTAEGNASFANFVEGGVFTRNVVIGASADRYPRNNFFPETFAAVGFVAAAQGDFRLGTGSPFRGAAPDGTDLGARFGASALGNPVRLPAPRPPPAIRVN